MTFYLNFEIYLIVMPKEFYELQMVQIVGINLIMLKVMVDYIPRDKSKYGETFWLALALKPYNT